MAETLGEKLRLAREARGITLSEVAAQTRIAARYLEAIEEDNYKPLPGGVFNKGFIKAYAKYVGVDEQEALNDYARVVSSQNDSQDDDLTRPRRSSVMTDDRNRSSFSSLIFAVIILALMSGGIYLLVQWYRSAPAEPQPVKNNPPANTNANSNSAVANTNTAVTPTDQLKVEIKALNGQAPFVSTTVDLERKVDSALSATEPRVLNPRNTVKISFSRAQAPNLQLTLNGKVINMPTEPLKPTDGSLIKFEINRNNVAQIINAGQVTAESQTVPAPTPNPAGDDTNTAVGAETPATGTPGTTPARPTPKPAVAKTPPPTAGNTAANTGVPAKTPVTRPTVITVPPAATPKRPGE